MTLAKPIEVRILNRENNTHYYMNLSEERLEEFFSLADNTRPQELPLKNFAQQGVSAGAALGLSAIFTYIPSRFPIESLFSYLQEEYLRRRGLPKVSLEEIEVLLEKFSILFPQLQGDGSEIE